MGVRMIRWAVNTMVAMSLLLSAGAAGMWVRSYWVSEQVVFAAEGGADRDENNEKTPWPVFLCSRGGKLFLSCRGEPAGIYIGGVRTRMVGPQRRWAWSTIPWMAPVGPTSFHMFTPPRYMNVPYWMLVVAFALPGGVFVARGAKRWRRRRWRARGCCVQCGYDLRATPERCPECGMEVKSVAAPRAGHTLRWRIVAVGAVCVLIAAAWGWRAARDHHRRARYQKMADEASWTWREEEAKAEHSIERAKGIVTASVTDRDPFSGTIQVSRNGKAPYRWRGVGWSGLGAFVIRGNRLVYAEYSTASCGCTLVGVDLDSGQVLWRNSLNAAGWIRHSAYSNEVAVDLTDDTVIVRGDEGAGRYIEIVDVETGETLGHRKF